MFVSWIEEPKEQDLDAVFEWDPLEVDEDPGGYARVKVTQQHQVGG